jgi:hypothetical protein
MIMRVESHAISLVLAWVASLSLSAFAQQGLTPRKIISLDGGQWKLVGLEPGEGEKFGINARFSDNPSLIPTSVPNDVQLAIGLKDPYGQDNNIVDINKREWWYVRSFPSPEVGANRQARLVFDGVDYFADVWLNGEKLGSHEGALYAVRFRRHKPVAQGSRQLPGGARYIALEGERAVALRVHEGRVRGNLGCAAWAWSGCLSARAPSRRTFGTHRDSPRGRVSDLDHSADPRSRGAEIQSAHL